MLSSSSIDKVVKFLLTISILSAYLLLAGWILSATNCEGADKLPPREFPALVVSVHDGDTLRAIVNLGFKISIEETFRLSGIDTPELPTPAGIAAGDTLRSLVNGKAVTLRVDGQEKYGRWLATVFVGKRNINSELLASGVAKPYSGGKR